jgi:TonB family protein
VGSFIKEAQTIARLNHPNIVKIQDIFEENDTAYYVMDFVEGSSLENVVKLEGAISELRAQNYIKQVADALQYMHNQNLCHLDVKPANLMLDNQEHITLIDFGLSKQYDIAGSQTSTTPIGISHGYAPIEQYNEGGVSSFSPQTDIYSLGATLYKMITGQTPPQASIIINEGLPELPSHVSSNIRQFIKSTMQFRKLDRPASIQLAISILEGTRQATKNTVRNTSEKKREDNKTYKGWVTKSIVSGGVLILFIIMGLIKSCSGPKSVQVEEPIIDSTEVAIEKLANEEPAYVDLGLSVKWAVYNIGADESNLYGDYFCWGDASGSMTQQSRRDFNNPISGSKDDIATAMYGGEWRLPTKEETEELINNCQWNYVTLQSGVNGYEVVGPNGNSIFLPSSGEKNKGEIKELGLRGNYWTGEWFKQYEGAYFLTFVNWKMDINNYSPSFQFSIRPVYGKLGGSIQQVKMENKRLASASNQDDNIVEEIDPVSSSGDEIYDVVEEMPEFPGGASAMMRYIGENVQYPIAAQKRGTEGRVIVSFVIDKEGSVVKPMIVRSVDPALDKEALRVVRSMPKWKPGRHKNKLVCVSITVPVLFSLI